MKAQTRTRRLLLLFAVTATLAPMACAPATPPQEASAAADVVSTEEVSLRIEGMT